MFPHLLKFKVMSKLIFDLEATGLLRQGSKVHCLVIQDAETGQATAV